MGGKVEDYKSIFKAKFLSNLKQVTEEANSIRETLKIVASDKGRQGHVNMVSESIKRIKGLIDEIENMDLREELIAEEAKRRLAKIIERAIIFAQEDQRYG